MREIKPRRGRPRAYEPGAALERAREVFWRAGYDGVSLDELSAATGMNRPSLYAAFGDKAALYLKTLEQYRDATRAIARELLADDPPLREFLARFYASGLDIYYDGGARGCYTVGTAATRALSDAKVRDFLSDSIASTDTLLARRFASARERGEIPAGAEPLALARLATGILHTIAVRARAGAPRAELEALARDAIATLCPGAASA